MACISGRAELAIIQGQAICDHVVVDHHYSLVRCQVQWQAGELSARTYLCGSWGGCIFNASV
jgi:hypothetical protein